MLRYFLSFSTFYLIVQKNVQRSKTQSQSHSVILFHKSERPCPGLPAFSICICMNKRIHLHNACYTASLARLIQKNLAENSQVLMNQHKLCSLKRDRWCCNNQLFYLFACCNTKMTKTFPTCAIFKIFTCSSLCTALKEGMTKTYTRWFLSINMKKYIFFK